MVFMLKIIFQNFRKIKSFNKIFILYAVIVITALLLIEAIVSSNITNMILDREIKYNRLILSNVGRYFEDKFKTSNLILQQASGTSDPAFDYMDTSLNASNSRYIPQTLDFDNYFTSAFSKDKDIENIVIYKKQSSSFTIFSKATAFTSNIKNFKYPSRLKMIDNSSTNIQIYPVYNSFYMKNINVYTLAVNIKGLSTNKNIGIQMIDFNPKGISELIRQNYENIYGSVLILKEDGSVIFDSSNTYYGSKYPFWNFKNSNSAYKINNREYVINAEKNSLTHTIILGILPVDQILNDMRGTKNTIFLISLLCILAAIVLTYISKTIYINRVQFITDAMKKVHNGNLSERIPISNSEDEINEIAQGFNIMCDNLEKYIDKVYISDIKQKRAELIALQSQINPHFLFNTLEVIRMNADMNGAQEAGDMIQILAKLFRNVVRMDTIIDIDDEIRNSKLYLDLFKIRYGDKLTVKMDIDPEILRLGIIKHLIQPVIENYMIHGFDISSVNNSITIKGFRDGNYVEFLITDNAKGMDPETLEKLNYELTCTDYKQRDSIGLSNVNDRIKIIYNKECGIQIFSDKGKGTKVRIKILAKSKKELTDYVQGIIS